MTAAPKHRFLISALIPGGVAHGFLSCRDRTHGHRVGAGERLGAMVERSYGLLPAEVVLMSTPLHDERVEEIIWRNMPQAKTAFDKCISKKGCHFFVMWVAPDDDPDSQMLLSMQRPNSC